MKNELNKLGCHEKRDVLASIKRWNEDNIPEFVSRFKEIKKEVIENFWYLIICNFHAKRLSEKLRKLLRIQQGSKIDRQIELDDSEKKQVIEELMKMNFNYIYFLRELPRWISQENNDEIKGFLKQFQDRLLSLKSLRNKIIKNNYYFVRWYVHMKYFNVDCSQKEEHISEGMTALMYAVDSFDVNFNTSFITYLKKCIRNQIQINKRLFNGGSRIAGLTIRLLQITEEFKKKNESVSDQQLCAEMDISLEELYQIRQYFKVKNVGGYLSLDQPLLFKEGVSYGSTFYDVVAAKRPSLEEILQKKQFGEILEKIVNNIIDKEKKEKRKKYIRWCGNID